MAHPKKTAAIDNRPGVDWIDVTPDGADVDLTDPSGPTGGYMARSLFVTGAGDVVFLAVGAPGTTPAPRTQTVPANFTIDCIVQKVLDTGTDATGIVAIL